LFIIHQSTYLKKIKKKKKKKPDNNNNSEEIIYKIFRYFSIHDESKAYHEMNESLLVVSVPMLLLSDKCDSTRPSPEVLRM
jgi:hypothetical protein